MEQQLADTLKQKEKQQNLEKAVMKKLLEGALKEKGYKYEQAVG